MERVDDRENGKRPFDNGLETYEPPATPDSCHVSGRGFQAKHTINMGRSARKISAEAQKKSEYFCLEIQGIRGQGYLGYRHPAQPKSKQETTGNQVGEALAAQPLQLIRRPDGRGLMP